MLAVNPYSFIPKISKDCTVEITMPDRLDGIQWWPRKATDKFKRCYFQKQLDKNVKDLGRLKIL